MRLTRTLAIIVTLAMAAAIVYGMINGDLAGDFQTLWEAPWGQVALVDLYLGLVIFGAWIWFRERGSRFVWLWFVALITLGNLAAGGYLIRASFQSADLRDLLLGRGADSAHFRR